MGIRVEHPGAPIKRPHRITILPTTVLGRWAVGLAAAFFALVFLAGVVPMSAALGIVCGLAAGIAAVAAVVRERERAVTVFVAFAPVAMAVGFVLAQLLG